MDETNTTRSVLKQRSSAKPSKRRRPHVSVCIANWNCRDLLRGCLRSLTTRRQGLRLEVIVVDNASSDGAANMVAREFPRVKLIRNQANLGFARANNQAAARARGRWLFFLNNDTVVPRAALRHLVHFARAHPEAGLVGPLLRDGKCKPQVSFRARPSIGALLHQTCLLRWTGFFRRAYRHYRARGQDFAATRSVDVLMGAALLVRRRDFRSVGGWDEGFTFGGEDIDLCLRIGTQKTVVYHPDVEVTHFGRVSSRAHIAFAQPNTIIGHTRVLRKNGASRPALRCYKIVKTLDAPLQALRHATQYLWRRARGRYTGAARSLLSLHADLAFLRKLPEFWRV